MITIRWTWYRSTMLWFSACLPPKLTQNLKSATKISHRSEYARKKFRQTGHTADLLVVQAVIKILAKRFKPVGENSLPHALNKINKKIDIMNRV